MAVMALLLPHPDGLLGAGLARVVPADEAADRGSGLRMNHIAKTEVLFAPPAGTIPVGWGDVSEPRRSSIGRAGSAREPERSRRSRPSSVARNTSRSTARRATARLVAVTDRSRRLTARSPVSFRSDRDRWASAWQLASPTVTSTRQSASAAAGCRATAAFRRMLAGMSSTTFVT